jgi:tetratricopeptide (TPR) repeat protein
MTPLDQYLSMLCRYLYIGENELSHRLEGFEELAAWIKGRLPYVLDARVFGSLTRRTGISMRTHPNADTDVLLPIDHAAFLERISTLLAVLKAEFEQHPECTDVRECAPCVSLKYRERNYDIFPVDHTGGSERYGFTGPFGDWEAAGQGGKSDERFHYGAVGVYSTSSDGKTGTLFGSAIPFYLNEMTREFHDDVYVGFFDDEAYGGLWRGLVLLLKYWKLSTPLGSGPPWMAAAPWSYVLEVNVLDGLRDSTRFNGCQGLFDFLHRFLSNPDLYDHRLLAQVPGFLELKERIERLQSSRAGSASDDDLRELGSIFPVPRDPVALERTPVHWLEADLGRARLSSFVKQDDQALAILRSTVARFDHDEDDAVAQRVCHARFSMGQLEEQLGRRDSALGTYRSIVRRYKRAGTSDGLAAQVLLTLNEEARMHLENLHPALAMAAHDEALSTYGDRTDPRCLGYLAAALFDKAAILENMESSEAALALYEELEREYASVDEVAVMEIRAEALLQRAEILCSRGDTERQVDSYSTIALRFGACEVVEIQALVIEALFRKGEALRSLGRHAAAHATFESLAARCSHLSGEPFGDCLAEADLWAAIINYELAAPSARARLEELTFRLRDHESERIRDAISEADRLLPPPC